MDSRIDLKADFFVGTKKNCQKQEAANCPKNSEKMKKKEATVTVAATQKICLHVAAKVFMANTIFPYCSETPIRHIWMYNLFSL